MLSEEAIYLETINPFFNLLKHLNVSPTKGRYDAREQGYLFAMQVCSNSCSILQLQKIDDNA